jgi:hypothetical protein
MSSTWGLNSSRTYRHCSAASAIDNSHFPFNAVEEMMLHIRTVLILGRPVP